MVLALNIWAEVEDCIVDPVREVLREVEDDVVKMQSNYAAMRLLTQVNFPQSPHRQKCAKNIHCRSCITKNPYHSTPKAINRPFPLVVEDDLRPETDGPYCECKPSQSLVQNIQSCRIPCCIIPHLGSFKSPEISKVGPTLITCKYPLLFHDSKTALCILQLDRTSWRSN